MNGYVRGDNLPPTARAEVLAAFIYRWTSDNPSRKRAYARIARPRVPRITDEEWLRRYAFRVTKAGRLYRRSLARRREEGL